VTATRVQDDRRCFACGPDNPHGLQLTFEYGDGTARTAVMVAQRFSGWSSVLHGGIVATLLDEAMAHAAISRGIRAVTARLEVRFRKAIPVGAPLVAEGRIESRRGRVLELSSQLVAPDGTPYAQARGRFVVEQE
jgi:uncharacterized protein (TIGR00369 family)